jgi:hypothetical protein
MSSEEPHFTYFGLWSEKDKHKASAFLSGLGIDHYWTEYKTERDVLVDWHAWDGEAESPNIGFDLWILETHYLEKLGNRLAKAFPERDYMQSTLE